MRALAPVVRQALEQLRRIGRLLDLAQLQRHPAPLQVVELQLGKSRRPPGAAEGTEAADVNILKLPQA